MVVVLFALIAASSAVSFSSYRATEWLVTEDMNQALAKTMAEQQSDVINCDTITVFNSHLQMEELRGQAVLAVDTHQGFTLHPEVSSATILGLSDQRPAMVLWTAVLLWGLFCLYHRRTAIAGLYGGLALRCTRRRDKADADAAATDGDVYECTRLHADKTADLRCAVA